MVRFLIESAREGAEWPSVIFSGEESICRVGHTALASLARPTTTVHPFEFIDSLKELLTVTVIRLLDKAVEGVTLFRVNPLTPLLLLLILMSSMILVLIYLI